MAGQIITANVEDLLAGVRDDTGTVMPAGPGRAIVAGRDWREVILLADGAGDFPDFTASGWSCTATLVEVSLSGVRTVVLTPTVVLGEGRIDLELTGEQTAGASGSAYQSRVLGLVATLTYDDGSDPVDVPINAAAYHPINVHHGES